MRHVTYILLSLLCFQSCLQDKGGRPNVSTPLENCNQVDLVYYNHKDTLTYQTTDSLEMAALTELISNKQDIIGDSCRPSGRIIYKYNGKTIITAEFSTSDTNENVDCNYVVYESNGEIYKHKLTYRTGMFIDDIIWHKLKWSSSSDHGPIRLHGDTGRVENKEFTKGLQHVLRDSTKLPTGAGL